jgi:hypothetical protein
MSPAISEAFLNQIVPTCGVPVVFSVGLATPSRPRNARDKLFVLKLTRLNTGYLNPRASETVMSLAAASEERKARLLALRKRRAGDDADDTRYVTPGFRWNLVLMLCLKW